MKKASILCVLLLAGCASAVAIADIIAQVKNYTEQYCNFRPGVDANIEQLLAAYYPDGLPAFGAVQTVGDAICSAPVTQAHRRRGVSAVTRIVHTPKGPIAVTGTAAR